MACQINTIARFHEVVIVKKHLLPLKQPPGITPSGFREDSWVWPEEDSLDGAPKPEDKSEAWLQDCQMSMSSTAEVLVIAHGKSMVVLTTKWDSQEEGDVKSKYHITWHGNPCHDPNETITSVLCLPLASQSKSSQCSPDWTCIVLGFSSGYVRFYTEYCCLLTSELLHNEPVMFLKCQAFQPALYSTCREPAEEVYVTYSSVVCIIAGFGLFQTLRACRNQLARVQANCVDKIQAPSLAFKKWGFQDQSSVFECEVAGPSTANTFDHLLTASLCGGFDTWYRSSAPQTSLVVAAGTKPFVAFHYALEGGAPPVLADVAKVMANKLKSAIGNAVPSWLLGGRKSQSPERVETVIEPAEPMGCRFGLCDVWREGNRVTLSPHRALCVVCDTLGRVILIDTLRGVALRMWKGYRDAQCGWLEVKDDSRQGSSSKHKIALFLVIYSPKKGIIEIWTMQQGPKIAFFPVSKNGRLVYTNYGLMGLNNIHVKGGNKSNYQCIFVEPNGLVSEIVVPFHFALSAKNGKRVRDQHLFKRLKTFLREQDYDNERLCEEVAKTVKELQTVEVRILTLEMLCCTKDITTEAMDSAIEAISQQRIDSESDDSSKKTLNTLTLHLKCLVKFFFCINMPREKPPDVDPTMEEETYPQMLVTRLSMAPQEVSRLLSLFETVEVMTDGSKPKAGPRVTFGDSQQVSLSEFLSCFDLNGHVGQHSAVISLKGDVMKDELQRVGGVVFKEALIGSDLEELRIHSKDSQIQPLHLVQLALNFWLGRNHAFSLDTAVPDMLHLAEILLVLCEIAGRDQVCAANNEVSPWWKKVRETIVHSVNPWAALTAAVVCRSAALSVERAGAAPDDDLDWEHVSFDTCQWGVLIGRLEDVVLLTAILSQRPSSGPEFVTEEVELSLEGILARGRGAVAEVTARWLAGWLTDPSLLVDDVLPGQERASMTDVEQTSSQMLGVMRVMVLRQHFPYSTASSVLLSNLCWEHMVAWSKSISEISQLTSAISCLQHVPAPSLKRGLCILIWIMHLKPPLEAATMLVQRVGRLPRERLCRQEVGLPDTAMAPLFQQCLVFLDLFLEVSCTEDEEAKPLEHFCEELWDVGPSGPPPVVELALAQHQVNYDLLHLHYQLVMMLYMLVTFNLKLVRPLSTLLDNTDQAALFSNISGNPSLSNRHPVATLVTARTQFLCRVVAGAVQLVQPGDTESGLPDTSRAVKWIGRCLTLASVWAVSSDTLRRHQICELYSNGYDRLAEELIPAVSDSSLLASQLLLIVGQRMRHIVHSSDLLTKLSQLSPALSTWLLTLPEGQLKSTNDSLSDMGLLLVPILQHLPEENADYELALTMVDAVHAFQA